MNPDFARVFRNFGNLYTVSEYNAGIVRDYNPNVRVIHNAVPDIFKGFSTPTDHVRFGYIGSYIPVKGVDLLLEAFAEIRNSRPAPELILAGDPWTDWGRALKAAHGNDPGVRWIGEVQKASKERFFDSIDVMCVPSLDEPSGLTVLEGLMHGKPVVTTDRTGANYAVDEKCGAIVRAGSTDALTDALRTLSAPAAVAERVRHARENYLRFGTPELERTAVLKMVADNIGSKPMVRGGPGSDRVPLFHEVRSMTGRRRFYLGGMKIFSIKGKGVKKRVEC